MAQPIMPEKMEFRIMLLLLSRAKRYNRTVSEVSHIIQVTNAGDLQH